MRNHLNKHIILIVLCVTVMALAGCSTTTEGSSADNLTSEPSSGLLSLPSPDLAMTTVTPAPSGFVPGDALPTPMVMATPTSPAGQTNTAGQYRELSWEELVPPGYRPEEIIAKYQDELNAFQDGDPAAMDLYMRMQEEFNNAPINSDLDLVNIKLPGFIAPLEYKDGLITEFLLVPYFGACIHVPPPPVNQTVHVILAEGEGILPGDSYYPFWVQGSITGDGVNTDLGEAGYRIEDAKVTLYTY